MKRPQPRASALAGLTPAMPVNASLPANNSIDGNAINTSDSGGEMVKVTVTVPAEIVGEARAAYWRTGHMTGIRSFSQWVAQAIETELEKARAEFNSGKPFEALPAGKIPTGRR